MTRKIGPAEWELHKSAILEMRKSGVKMNGPNGIIDTMDREHGFKVTCVSPKPLQTSADAGEKSHSQMELQLSKWQERRKLSKIEWCQIFHIVDRYKEAGRSCSVKMNGVPIPTRILKKNQRLYGRGTEYPSIRHVSQNDLPACITIEVGTGWSIDTAARLGCETFSQAPTDDQPQSTMLEEGIPSAPFVEVSDHGRRLPESNSGVPFSSTSTDAEAMSHLDHVVSHLEESDPKVLEDISNFPSGTTEMQVIEPSTSENQWPCDHLSINRLLSNIDMRFLSPSEQQVRGFFSTPHTLRQTMGLLDSDFDPAREGFVFPYDCVGNSSEWLPSPGAEICSELLLDAPTMSDCLPAAEETQIIDHPTLSKAQSFLCGNDMPASRQAITSDAAMKNNLTALLPPDNFPATELLCQRNLALNQVFTSPFFRVLISSIENNYAGLEKVPIGEIFKLLRNDAQMRSKIVQYIQRSPKALATALVEKLLMAAIEEQDSASVAELLKTQLVQVNEAKCIFEGVNYKAIERSVMLPSPEVFWILLQAGANPSPRHKLSTAESTLDLALKAMRRHGHTHLSMVQTLLDHRVTVTASSVLTALELNDKELIDLVLSEFEPLDDHTVSRNHYPGSISIREPQSSLDGSQMEAIVSVLFKTFEEGVALSLLRQMIMKRGSWRKSDEDCVNRLATKAIESGYVDAFQLFLPLTTTRAGPFAAAVRHRCYAIVDLLLVSDLRQALSSCRLNDEDRHTTPLAEAIRLQEFKILERFEKHPQWKRLWSGEQGDKRGLAVTLCAACEVGNLAYCQKILRTIRKLFSSMFDDLSASYRTTKQLREHEINLSYCSDALHISVENGHEDIAICLMNAGIRATFHSQPSEGPNKDGGGPPSVSLPDKAHKGQYHLEKVGFRHHCLFQAVRQRKRVLFERILDSDFCWNDVLAARCAIYALKHNLKWALDGLMRMRPRYDSDFLEETFSLAIREGLKAEFDSIVLHHKLSIETNELTGLFTGDARALNEAVKSGDVSMIHDFLNSDSGLRLALILTLEALEKSTKEAIEEGTSLPQASFATILRSFKAAYPNGVRGFGSLLLQYAILREDAALLDIMLEAKLDVNDRPKVNTTLSTGCTALGAAIQHRCKSQLDTVRKILGTAVDLNKCVVDAQHIRNETGPYKTQVRRKDTQSFRHTPRTALLEAILQEDLSLVQLLIEFGADIDQEARYGVKRTPLQAACEVGATEIVDFLLNRGARADEPPAFRGGATSLQLCAAHGHVGTAIKLLDRGADIHASPSFTKVRPALQGAARNGRLDMISLLWQRAGDRRFDRKACIEARQLATYGGHAACSELIRELAARDGIASDPTSMYE